MATRDRTGFLQQAIGCFLRQTYAKAELIVVDDGKRPGERFCRHVPGVRYIRLNRPTPLGSKLNLGIEHSRGSILQKLDDDDYYGPDFLRLAVASLARLDPEHSLAAWDCFLILLIGARRLRFSGHGWHAGGTLCFFRALWKRRPFRDLPRAVDSWFLYDHQPAIIPVCAPEQYLVVRHGGNTWNHMAGGGSADGYLRNLPPYAKPLADLVDPAALAFYRMLARRRRGRH